MVSSDFGSNIRICSQHYSSNHRTVHEGQGQGKYVLVYRFTKGVVKLLVITDIQYIYACTELIQCKEGVGSSTISSYGCGTHRAACD